MIKSKPMFGTTTLIFAVSAAAIAQQSATSAAGYVLRGGPVQIVAARSMAGTTRAIDDVFMQQRARTHVLLRTGDNYSSMSALTFDRSLVAPMGCQYTRIGLGNNLKIAADPVGVRIAHAALEPGDGVPALAVIVNPSNPLAALSMQQLARIFTAGSPGGDIATWSQAGVTGELAARGVMPAGPMMSDYLDSEDPQAGEFLSIEKFNGLLMNHRYAELSRYADVVARVREDPAAIGIIGLTTPHEGVRVIALKAAETGRAVLPTADAIGAGEYPLDRFVYVYLRMGKGAPADPLALNYAQIALSADGQRAIAGAAEHYIPLSAEEIAIERARLKH